MSVPPVEERPELIKLGDPELADVTLTVGNQDFLAHKMILGARIEYFKGMFFRQFKEANEDRVEIKDVSVSAFRHLLEIVYYGKVGDEEEFLSYKNDYSPIRHSDTYIHNRTVYSNPRTIHEHVKKFWKHGIELLKAADQFCLTPLVKEYLQRVISKDICGGEEECEICWNRWLFSMKHDLDVEHKHKNFSQYCIQYWHKLILAGTLDETVEFSNKEIATILHKCDSKL